MDEDKFSEMYDVDCFIQAGLYETFMRGAGTYTGQESFDAFIAETNFEWWEEHILPARERIMIKIFGEDEYGVYAERSLDEHWG